jgi:putative PEP-CTERM system integral membrane protein
MKINKETIKRRSAFFIFWVWHLIYSVLVFGLIIPSITFPLLEDASMGNVPVHYLIYILMMLFLPFVSMYLAAVHFRQNFRSLMKYFYGFEMPLLFFLIIRMMTFRDSNNGMSWLMLNVIIALTVWFIFVWQQNRQDNNQLIYPHNPVAVAGSTLLAMVGVYFGIQFLIIMTPTAVEFFSSMAHAFSRTSLQDILLAVINPLLWLTLVFVIFTMTLFIALPVIMIYLYIGQFIRRLPSLFTPFSAINIAIVLAVIGINAGIFTYFNQQPQQAVFTLLEKNLGKPEAETALLQQADTIREGLLNAYLARYRYVSTAGLSQRIKSSYQDTFHLDSATASIPQSIFNSLAVPFLYDGKDWSDIEKARKLYADFFDTPIQKAESEIILDAVKHNWEMSRDNEAGLLDAVSQYVHLNQQAIDIQENQGVATITIRQTLENLTYAQKETVLHFSLPNDAVLTGLWLSDDRETPQKYPFVLAPKGAAQAVYKAEVNRRVDPALLEQTGPYQYRLRVYPIPQKKEPGKPATPLYVQFTYQTLGHTEQGKAGNWPLPDVLEKRNLFQDQKTEQTINGKKIPHSANSGIFPKKLTSTSGNLSARAYRDGDNLIRIIPRQKNSEKLPNTGHYAILIDGSYSMAKHQQTIKNTLSQLTHSKAQFDIWFCRKTCSPATDKPVFFGNSQPADQLTAFSQQLKTTNTKPYDAIFLLSDDGSYELQDKSETQTQTNTLKLTPPLWLVHLGNNPHNTLPYAYDDKVLDLIYSSKGGVTLSLKEALIRNQYMQKQHINDCGESTLLLSISDNHLWTQTHDPQHHCNPANNPALATLATAQQIRYLSRTINHTTDHKLDKLDTIHALAKQKGIVTHYSSMLVLINDRQKEALKKAEQGKDRFEREIEKGTQTTTTPNDPFAVPSVPEPEEWALIIIAGILLTTALLQRRKKNHIPITPSP